MQIYPNYRKIAFVSTTIVVLSLISATHGLVDLALCPGGGELYHFSAAGGVSFEHKLLSSQPANVHSVAYDSRSDTLYSAAALQHCNETFCSLGEHALFAAPRWGTGQIWASQMTGSVGSSGCLAASESAMGTAVGQLCFSAAQSGFPIRSLVMTEFELLIVTRQDILSVSRTALLADPTGSNARLSGKLPLPDTRSYTDPVTGSPMQYDWASAAWAPDVDRLYALMITLDSASRAVLHVFHRRSTAGSDVAAWTTVSLPGARSALSLGPNLSPYVGRTLAYLPPDAVFGVGPRLAFVAADRRVVSATLFINGTVSSFAALAGYAIGSQTASFAYYDGRNLAPAVGVDFGTIGSVTPWAVGNSTVALLSLRPTSSGPVVTEGDLVFLWPNGSFASVKHLMPVRDPFASGYAPEKFPYPRLHVRLPLGAAQPNSTLDVLISVVDELADQGTVTLAPSQYSSFQRATSISVCRPTADLCPAGQQCTLISPRKQLLGCGAGLFCQQSLRVLSEPQSLRGPVPWTAACPDGHMCTVANQTAPTPCPAGYMCSLDEGNTTTGRPEYSVVPCSPGHWCPEGRVEYFKIGAYPALSRYAPDSELSCEQTTQIFGNGRTPCPECTDDGARSGYNAPKPCRCKAGVLCPGGSGGWNGFPTGSLCPPGLFCGAVSATPTGACAPGYFCPEGSISSELTYLQAVQVAFRMLRGICPSLQLCFNPRCSLSACAALGANAFGKPGEYSSQPLRPHWLLQTRSCSSASTLHLHSHCEHS